MKLNLLLATLLISANTVFAEMPKAGDAAPAFDAKDQDGKTVKLADFAAKKNVLLYFTRRILPAARRKPLVPATAWATCRRTTWKSSASVLILPRATRNLPTNTN